MKVMLINPPHLAPISPSFGLAQQNALLRQHGISSCINDVATESFIKILSPHRLMECLERLTTEFYRLEKKDYLEIDKRDRYLDIASIVSNPESMHYVENIEKTLDILRNEETFYDFDKYDRAWESIHECLDIVSKAYSPVKMNRIEFEIGECEFTVDGMYALLSDRYENPYLPILNYDIVPKILAQDIQMISLNISTRYQLTLGLMLARLLKSQADNIHINLQGRIVTQLIDVFSLNRKLFEFFDSVIFYEPEFPILQLALSLKNNDQLAEVPNLAFTKGKELHINKTLEPMDLDAMPTPDFDGFSLNDYLSPCFSIPVVSASGCYWRRCRFCDEYIGFAKHSRGRDAKKLTEMMEQLSSRHGADLFRFENTFVTSEMLESISYWIKAMNLEVRWCAKTRVEPGLTAEILERAYGSGCIMINYGIESGSETILTMMDKGISLDVARKILETSDRIGIWNHAYFLFHYPGETLKDTQQTLQFVEKNRHYIQSINFNIFSLRRGSIIDTMDGVSWSRSSFSERSENLRSHLDFDYAKIDDPHLSKQYSVIVNKLRTMYPLWHRVFPKEHFFLTLAHYEKHDLQEICNKRSASLNSVQSNAVFDGEIEVFKSRNAYSQTLRHDPFKSEETFGIESLKADQREKPVVNLVLMYRRFVDLNWNIRLFQINREASELIEYCEGGRRSDELVDFVSEKYCIGKERAGEFLEGFLNKMIEARVLECSRVPD